MNYRELTAPCGIDCFNCEVFGANITPELQTLIASYRGMDPSEVRCGGCRETGCLVLPEGACATKRCVEERGVEFCFECDEFPCRKLQPCLNGAEKYPQNFKLFNLCRMQKVGVETWAREESARIRALYKRGTLDVGNGPVLEDDHE